MVEQCEFEPTSECGCIKERNREECLLCFIAQQGGFLKTSSELMVANAINLGGQSGLEIIIGTDRIMRRISYWIQKYRPDLVKESEEREEAEKKILEEQGGTIIFGPEGLMTRDAAIARLKAMGKDSELRPA